ncbi:unnamed protein product [Trichobilharzia regenti]|nr:unnamed protein product [Trichobilharzia regenti]
MLCSVMIMRRIAIQSVHGLSFLNSACCGPAEFCIHCVLRSRGSTKIGCGPKSREKEELEVKRNRRTNQMLIAMVVIFVVCWIPLNVLWVVADIIGEVVENSVHFHNTFILCHMIAMSSAVYNPFLYAWLNNNFRQELKAVFHCNTNLCSKQSSMHTMTTTAIAEIEKTAE